MEVTGSRLNQQHKEIKRVRGEMNSSIQRINGIKRNAISTQTQLGFATGLTMEDTNEDTEKKIGEMYTQVVSKAFKTKQITDNVDSLLKNVQKHSANLDSYHHAMVKTIYDMVKQTKDQPVKFQQYMAPLQEMYDKVVRDPTSFTDEQMVYIQSTAKSFVETSMQDVAELSVKDDTMARLQSDIAQLL